MAKAYDWNRLLSTMEVQRCSIRFDSVVKLESGGENRPLVEWMRQSKLRRNPLIKIDGLMKCYTGGNKKKGPPLRTESGEPIGSPSHEQKGQTRKGSHYIYLKGWMGKGLDGVTVIGQIRHPISTLSLRSLHLLSLSNYLKRIVKRK